MFTTIFNSDNQLLHQARQGKRLSNIWVVVILAFVIPLVSGIAGGIVSALFNMFRHVADVAQLVGASPAEVERLVLPETAFEQMFFLAGSFIGIYGLLGLWVWLFEKRSFLSLGLLSSGWAFQLGRGLAVGLILFGLAVTVIAAGGFYQLKPVPPITPSVVGGILLVLVGWLVQGPAEEILFRGWVLPVLGARYNVWVGVGVSSVVFALLHSLNPHLNVVAMVNLVLFGLLAGLYALYEEGVWGVFGIHAAWNWAQGNVFGLEVSGAPVVGGSFINLKAVGPDLITGGLFGPEGGLAVTVALGCAIGGVVWLQNQKKAKNPY